MDVKMFEYRAKFDLLCDVDDQDFNIAGDYLYNTSELIIDGKKKLPKLFDSIYKLNFGLQKPDGGIIVIESERELSDKELKQLNSFLQEQTRGNFGRDFEERYTYSWYNDHTGEEEYIIPSFATQEYAFEKWF